jgi:sulfiredoxin
MSRKQRSSYFPALAGYWISAFGGTTVESWCLLPYDREPLMVRMEAEGRHIRLPGRNEFRGLFARLTTVRDTRSTAWAADMKLEKLEIAKIYVPVKRRATLKPEIVDEIAQSMLEVGQTTPILVRRDGERFVLVHGLHRLEACKALGEESILGYLVQAAKH